MRDPCLRAHVTVGLRVKIVRPEDEETGVVTEGLVAEVVSKVDHEPDGVLVKLASGEEGRVLRIWEGGLAPVAKTEPDRRALPTYDPPREPRPQRVFSPSEAEIERELQRALAGANAAEIERMIDRHQDGLTGPSLKRFGIKSDELEAKSRKLVDAVSDAELARRLGAGPTPDRDPDDAEARGPGGRRANRGRSDDDDDRPRNKPRRR